jgi:hypothetical protein
MSTFKDKMNTMHDQFMSDLVTDDGLSAVNLSKATGKNKRVATRYVRDDIILALCEITQFSFGKEIFIDFVKLNDITGRGLSFSINQYIAINKKVVLNLAFHSERTFKITATIIYRTNSSPYQYGVKFTADNYQLSDHLLETQRNLVFK